ncbi:MAG: response regulator transcription factor [Chloroflexi bacterium]|nr:MAG: response regulator transcription factor [Chloroflexota bacterium]
MAGAVRPLTTPARLLIADDHALFRSGLARLLAQDLLVEVVGEAVDGVDAVEKAALITDENPDIKVLMLTTFEAWSDVLRALRAGASGYILKDARPDLIVLSIVAVRSGARVLASTATRHVLDMIDVESCGSAGNLTPRESEVLKLMSAGFANSRIASELNISGKTVRNHVSHLYAKLQVYDRSQAILYALRKGLAEL